MSEILDDLQARGPDSLQHIQRCIDATNPTYLTFVCSVLSLRGRCIVEQPRSIGEHGPILCWNGECWKRNGRPIHGNDTDAVFKDLLALFQADSWRKLDAKTRRRKIAVYFSETTGPFSFILLDCASSVLYFGRDQTGRRSLILQESDSGTIQISSTSDSSCSKPCIEIESSGIHSIDLNSLEDDLHIKSIVVNTDAWILPQSHVVSQNTREYDKRKRLVNSKKTHNSISEEDIASMIGHCQAFLARALHTRLASVERPQGSAVEKEPNCSQPSERQSEKLGILFSGGLDCTIIARLAHDILPLGEPIALLNVAFENPRLAARQTNNNELNSENNIYEACPDRKTSRKSFAELCNTCLGREWRFITINVSHEETKQYYPKVVSLMKPHNNEMDLSIAMALYFATRGEGFLFEKDISLPYSTKAIVLLSGLGADELFGGYLRHETAYKRGGVNKLIEELQLDIDRIGKRNLGRDDRVTACWGKEIRYPFLDEEFVDWALQTPIGLKYAFAKVGPSAQDLCQTNLEPSKYLLRRMSIALGLRTVAHEKKRAIQFGSRSAKMLDRKVQGTDPIQISLHSMHGT